MNGSIGWAASPRSATRPRVHVSSDGRSNSAHLTFARDLLHGIWKGDERLLDLRDRPSDAVGLDRSRHCRRVQDHRRRPRMAHQRQQHPLPLDTTHRSRASRSSAVANNDAVKGRGADLRYGIRQRPHGVGAHHGRPSPARQPAAPVEGLPRRAKRERRRDGAVAVRGHRGRLALVLHRRQGHDR